MNTKLWAFSVQANAQPKKKCKAQLDASLFWVQLTGALYERAQPNSTISVSLLNPAAGNGEHAATTAVEISQAKKPLQNLNKKQKRINLGENKNHKKRKSKRGKATSANLVPLGKNSVWNDKKKKEGEEKLRKKESESKHVLVSTLPSDQQLHYFLGLFQKANGLRLSPLELQAFKDSCIVKLSSSIDQDVENLSQHVKSVFGESWEDVLCGGELSEGSIDPGSPAILIVSGSARRSLELLRGLKEFTKKCRPAKLFAKHMKVEDQVSLLKGRVNIASGTPSRIKKLIDMDALLLSRLAVIVLDMHRDAKGYSLFALPQVSMEFWDLYKTHFQSKLLEGDTRICFYGSTPQSEIQKALLSEE